MDLSGKSRYALIFQTQPFTSVFSLRILSAKAWEDRPIVLRQIDQIGDKSSVAFSFLDLVAELLTRFFSIKVGRYASPNR